MRVCIMIVVVTALTLFTLTFTNASEVDRDMVIGNWCFKSIEISGDHQPENRNYKFKRAAHASIKTAVFLTT